MKRLWLAFVAVMVCLVSGPGLDRHSHLSGDAADS